jgi:Caspase domain
MAEQSDKTTASERKLAPLATNIADVPQGRSLVVVIGINEYIHQQKLKNAVQDAIGLQQTLIDKLGFSAPVPPLLNEAATRGAILSLIEDQLYEVIEEDDSLIFFFAGHGQTRVRKVGDTTIKTGYLIPVDATQSWSDYIEIDPFLKSLSTLPARHILVILDSCHSGFALGQAMQSFRDLVRYEKDLSSRISRKVITSAQQEQLALDGGPIPGHSLFTGTMVEGFNWGKADLDGNGLITSSELGLFIQQQVGQASESKQTPDFGSFHLDDRGEMVISLRNQSFDALKARAFSALQTGELIIFKELTEQLVSMNVSSPEVLYLKYRLHFSECNIEKSIKVLDQLDQLNFSEGVIPLSSNDLWNLRWTLPCWTGILSIIEGDFPVDVKFLTGGNQEALNETKERNLGTVKVNHVEYNSIMQFEIYNPSNIPVHIYMTELSSEGRLTPIVRFWQDTSIMLSGIAPGERQFSAPFRQVSSIGICELRLFSSPKSLEFFLFPPTAGARSVGIESVNEDDLKNIRMKSIRYSMTPHFG